VPWCDPCAKYLTPSSVNEDGSCPTCGESVEHSTLNGERITADTLDLRKLAGKESEKLPWHFKLLVGLLCLYMGWRIVQLFV
jgi:hypothetical protein